MLHLQKIILTLILSATLCESSFAQFVTVPNNNFVNWLNTHGYSSCLSGNQLDTTCNAVLTTKSVNLNNLSINDVTGITYFDSLLTFQCQGNGLTFLPQLPASLYTLSCSNNLLTSLPALPDSLYNFSCNQNQLTVLPPLPNTLRYLICSTNQLTTLPALSDSMIWLLADKNQLTSVPALPSTLVMLRLNENDLTSLPALPDSLRIFYCQYNQLDSLPELPLPLVTLICSNNNLDSLPVLPPSLHTLSCAFNQLTSLPNLPHTINSLVCNGNQLTSLPALSDSLYNLDCSFNNITSLPNFPANKLLTVTANNNLLTTTPDFPSTVRNINMSANQLTSLGNLPDTLNLLYINNNPSLSCLPELSYSISGFYWDSTAITCLPNQFINSSANPSIGSLPLCDIINSNNCPLHWNLQGIVYADNNNNCLADSGEIHNPNIKVKLYQNGTLMQQTFTDAAGRYTFSVDTGTYDCVIDTATYISSCIPSYTVTVTPLQQYHANLDFGIHCSGKFDVGVLSVQRNSGIFRPGVTAGVTIVAGDLTYKTLLHCSNSVSGTITVVINGPATYVGTMPGALTPSAAGNTLTYSISDNGTVDIYNDFKFTILTDTQATVGAQICFDVTVTPFAGDADTINNSYQHCFAVVNSYDPNMKEVSPMYIYESEQDPQYLTYTIYFQNTGVAPAMNIYIVDTLDANLDITTFEMIDYSYHPSVTINGNIALFRLEKINLIDSVSDEPGSHGYVQYKIRTNALLPLGASYMNTAYIYFDYNSPVITNTVNTVITPVSSVHHSATSSGFFLFPNPTSGSVVNYIYNSSEQESDASIYDMAGRKICIVKIKSSADNQRLHLPYLDNGVYHLRIDGTSENMQLMIRH